MIRLANNDDFPLLVNIWLAASREAHAFISDEFWLSQAKAMRDQYLPGAETYVACDAAGMPVGFLSLVEDSLAALFVDPAQQGKGIGSTLLRQGQSLRKGLGLCVYVNNDRAQKFYRRHGFKPVEERLDERTGERELFMQWSTT